MKKFFFAIMATIFIISTESCKKEAPEPEDIIKNISSQTIYTVSSFDYYETDILGIISLQYGSNEKTPVLMDIAINSSNDTAQKVSVLHSNPNYAGQTMLIKKLSKNTIFIEFRPAIIYAGNRNITGTPPPQKLVDKGILEERFNSCSGCGTWYGFNPNYLSGIYEVSEIKTDAKVIGYELSNKGNATFTILK